MRWLSGKPPAGSVADASGFSRGTPRFPMPRPSCLAAPPHHRLSAIAVLCPSCPSASASASPASPSQAPMPSGAGSTPARPAPSTPSGSASASSPPKLPSSRFSTLAAIAGRTHRLKFGVNATVLPLRDPLVLAKECATIDYLSDGRLLTVFGVGDDTAPEWQALGVRKGSRGRRANEMLELLPRLWTEDHVNHYGEFFHYRDVTINPKPKQSPLPLWIGGSSDAAIERTARYGSGWIGGGAQPPAQIARVISAIRERAEDLGRPLTPITSAPASLTGSAPGKSPPSSEPLQLSPSASAPTWTRALVLLSAAPRRSSNSSVSSAPSA